MSNGAIDVLLGVSLVILGFKNYSFGLDRFSFFVGEGFLTPGVEVIESILIERDSILLLFTDSSSVVKNCPISEFLPCWLFQDENMILLSRVVLAVLIKPDVPSGFVFSSKT